jgi:cell wall-associated NlpC family hydrolase
MLKEIFFSVSLIYSITGCVKKKINTKNVKNIKNRANSYQIAPNIVIKEAMKYLGKPYKYGKTGPDSFDCSGFVYRVYRDVGVSIPRTSLEQSKIKGKKLSKYELKKGDILFFDTANRGHINHSGIYIGDSKFIHASSGKAHSVTISNLNGWYKDKFRWGKRLINR